MSLEKVLKDSKDPSTGISLYDHLKGVLARLLFDNPTNAFARFEQYSFTLRGTKQEEVVFRVKESFNHLKQYERRNRALLGKINTGTDQEPQEPPSISYVPNLMNENKLFQRVGAGIGEEEAFRLYKSLSKLVVKKNAKQARFWGKILASGNDYYIAEGLAEGGEEYPEITPDTEAKGTGVNKLYYWATTQLSGDWTELPLITPSQLRVSRKIKVMFTGDLNRKIISNPHFLGKESHLLKCQIVRITASSTLVPKGMYAPKPDDPNEIDLAQEWKCPDVKTLSKIQNWVHLPQVILKVGRLTHQKPQGLEPQEEEKVIKATQKKDPYEPPLKSISLDQGQSWKIGLLGENSQWSAISKDAKPINYGIITIKSLIWPGWTTVHYLGKTTSIYLGYGFKAKQSYYPCEPERILEEQADRQQVSEPN